MLFSSCHPMAISGMSVCLSVLCVCVFVLSKINKSCVCMFVCVLYFCYLGNTPQYLSQLKSDLHKMFSIFSDWSPDLIYDVHLHSALKHAYNLGNSTHLNFSAKLNFLGRVCCVLKTIFTLLHACTHTLQPGA